MMLGSLAGALILAAVGWVLGSRLKKQLQDFENAMSELFSVFSQEATGNREARSGGDILGEDVRGKARRTAKRIRDLETRQKEMEAILMNMEEGVIAVDAAKRVLMMNHSGEKIFEVSHASAAGRSFIEVVKDQRLEVLMDRAIQQEGAVPQEVEFSHRLGKVLSARAVGLERTDLGVSGILVARDVTDIKKLESMRRDFVANVSHELRTPLTSIAGFIETLASGTVRDAAQSQRFLSMMREDADRLNRLLLDLLELSKLESRDVPLKFESVDLAEIRAMVEKTFSSFQLQISEKRLVVHNDIAASHDVRMRVDRDRLKQVIINLIDNAIKFNRDSGEIRVSALAEDNQMTVTVEDTGMGIPPEAKERVFERFFRVDKARTRALGGTGLGLSIVKHIVETHGGSVACESQLGRSSTFSVTLPLA
jgi:two-component system phosphate regulon sensor histidine kinase PhoR